MEMEELHRDGRTASHLSHHPSYIISYQQHQITLPWTLYLHPKSMEGVMPIDEARKE